MKVTIGIPCYNQAEYLPEAVESALNQTVECEVIVVNDGSTDNTQEVAERYPVKVINQVNKGLSSARNTVLMNMTGDYLLPLDADDIFLKTCAEKLLKKAEETSADVVAPSMQNFGDSNETITIMEDPQLADFRTGNRIPYASLVRRSVLQEVGGYSPRMIHGYEDYHLWFNLLSPGKRIITIPDHLLLYRVKAKSMYKDALEHHSELMEQIFKDFPNVLPEEK